MTYDMEEFYGEVALFNALKGWTTDKEYSYETVSEMLKGQLEAAHWHRHHGQVEVQGEHCRIQGQPLCSETGTIVG